MKDQWREIYPGKSEELLKALHILTRDGKLNQDSKRKLKQVLHLAQLITPKLETHKTIVDLGAGKSYLGFILYDLLLRNHDEMSLLAVESRKDLITTCQTIARASKFDRIQFIESSIADSHAHLPPTVDVITALHACDTATDDAILLGLKKEAKVIALVPCCQAEVARSLESLSSGTLKPLWAQGIHRREFGSHLTNVIRCLVLEAHGYKVRATEFIGFEHTLKNEMILAERHHRSNPVAKRALDALLKEIPIEMKLLEQLKSLTPD